VTGPEREAPYESLGGGVRRLSWAERYPEAAAADCDGCGEPAGSPCMFVAQFPSPSGLKTERRQRHAPCVGRGGGGRTDTGQPDLSAQEAAQSQERGKQ
jgi:hypothetical protein